MEDLEINFLRSYKGKKVLITGHTGFKGAWLSIWLHNLGANVIGYSLDPQSKEGIFETTQISKHITDIRGNVCDLKKLREVFKKEQPEIVFHLAAQSLVIEGYQDPVTTFETNIMGTVNVLEAIHKSPSVKAAVIITTDKCYENKEKKEGYREDEPMGGYDPYSASKGAAELVISAYRRSFFSNDENCKVASARAGNVIGGGDWSENRLIPDIIRAIKKNEIIEIRSPDAIRPWQHVMEPLCGYLRLGAELMKGEKEFCEGWNFGPHQEETYSVKQVIEKMFEVFGKGHWKDISKEEHYHEASILKLNIDKAIKKLGWKPILNFDECIKFTADWYNNAEKENTFEMTSSQIKKYQELWNSRNSN